MEIGAIKRAYERRVGLLRDVEQVALYALDQTIKKNKVKVHSLVSRVKEFDSFSDKVRAKSSEPPFTDIHDVLGLRIVCLFRSDVDVLTDIIRATFEVVEEEDKEDLSASDVFGYMGKHFIARLQDDSSTQVDDDRMDTYFEIQLRTVGQHVWASLSHHLDYKGRRSVPDELRRDFYALSGLFHIADTQFELLRSQQLDRLARPRATDTPD